MAAGNEIWFAIRAETSEAEAGLQRVANRAAGMEGSFNGAGIAGNEVRQGISLIAKEAMHASSAMDLLMVATYASEKALEKFAGTGLAATVVVAVAYQIYKAVEKDREEFEKLEAAADKAMDFSAWGNRVAPLNAVVEKLKEVNKEIEENRRVLSEQSGQDAVLWDTIGSLVSHPIDFLGGKNPLRAEQTSERLGRLESSKSARNEDSARSANEEYQLLKMELEGEAEYGERVKIRLKYEREIAELKRQGATAAAAIKESEAGVADALLRQKQKRKAQDLDRANAIAESKLGLGGSDYDRKRSGLVLDQTALREEARVLRERGGDNAEALAKKKDIEARAKDEEIDRLDMEHDKAVRAAQDELADAEDNAPAYQRIENALQRKIEAAKREMQMLEERGELDDEAAAKYQAVIAGAQRDLEDKRKVEEHESDRLDVEMEKANVEGDKSLSRNERKREQARLEKEYWQQESGRTDISENERKRAEINAKRAENEENADDEENTKRRDPRIASSSLGRVGLGGRNYIGGAGSLEHIAGRQLNVLEQIARNTGGGQKAMDFGRRVMTLAE